MRKHIKTVILSATVACMALGDIYATPLILTYDGVQHEYNQLPIVLNVNGDIIETEVMPPVIIDNRVLVPVREVFEPLGATIEWRNDEKAVYLGYGETAMILKADDPNIWINGTTITTDVPTKLVNDKVMVPVRVISENMNFEVEWVEGNPRVVYIKENTAPETDDVPKPEVEAPDVDNNYTPEKEPEEDNNYTPEEEPEVDNDYTPEEEPEVDNNYTPEEDPDDEPEEDEDEKNPVPDGSEDKELDDVTVYPSKAIQELFTGIVEVYNGEQNKSQVYINAQNLASAEVKSVSVSQSRDEATAKIEASGQISDIEVSKQNGKLIIDILNSKSGLASAITPSQNTYIQAIRTSQFNETTTRVVFDLKSGTQADIALSTDRQTIHIDFSQQWLEGLVVGEDNKGDYIVIENMVPEQIEIEPYGESGIVYMHLPNTRIEDDFEWNRIRGQYIDEVHAQSNSEGTELLIVMNQDEGFIHTVENKEGHTAIYFQKSTYDHIKYVGSDSHTITLEKVDGLDVKDLSVNDLYREHKIIIDLGGNYEDHFGYGEIKVGDSVVESIGIDTAKNTQITINETTVHAVNLTEDDEHIYIEIVKPKEKYSRIVILDIGHGGVDGGASANGLKEKDINYKQTMLIKEKLEAQTDIKVYLTREDDSTLTLAYRTELANEIEGDIFISVHNNATVNNVTSGTEVLYYPSSTDSRGKRMAQIMQDHLVSQVGTVDRGIKERADLYVLRTSAMPALLLEGGFLTNPNEAANLNSAAFTEKYAQGAVNAIVEIFNTMSFR